MVDALTSKGDEGRGVAAIRLGEVRSNRRSEDFRMEQSSTVNLCCRVSLSFDTIAIARIREFLRMYESI